MQENDLAPHFAPLFALLEAVSETRHYSDPDVGERVAHGAAAARRAGVPPEAVLAFLRRRLHEAPLSAVGDWYRGVLVERLIAHASGAYFDVTDTAADGPTPSR